MRRADVRRRGDRTARPDRRRAGTAPARRTRPARGRAARSGPRGEPAAAGLRRPAPWPGGPAPRGGGAVALRSRRAGGREARQAGDAPGAMLPAMSEPSGTAICLIRAEHQSEGLLITVLVTPNVAARTTRRPVTFSDDQDALAAVADFL